MDLARFDTIRGANEGADMHIRHPGTGEPLYDGETPVTMRLCGEDGERWRKALREAGERRRRSGARDVLPDDAAEEETCEILASISSGWSGISAEDGQSLEFSHEAAREQYRRLPWLREQALAFKSNRANFIPAA